MAWKVVDPSEPDDAPDAPEAVPPVEEPNSRDEAPPAARPAPIPLAPENRAATFGWLALGIIVLTPFVTAGFANPFMVFPMAVASIILGALAIAEEGQGSGASAGRVAGVIALVLGTVTVTLAYVLPILVFLFLWLFFGATYAQQNSCTCDGSGSGGSSGSDTSCDCPGACDCGSCGDCDCGCGSCGDCGCGDCGGCDCGGCLALTTTSTAHAHAPLSMPKDAAGWNRFLAHHPDTPAYAQDVLRVGALRLCIGCVVTYPAYLLGIAVLTLAPTPVGWLGLLQGGSMLAAVQLVSSAGWAKWAWLKVLVKSCFGAGLAAVTVGVLLAPWSNLVQAGALLGAMALAFATGIPRRLRMGRA